MSRKPKELYPGVKEAEKQREISSKILPEPDFVGGKPNYKKWSCFSPEKVLVKLNVD